MRRSQKLKDGEECLGCLLRNDPHNLCHRGTKSGDCIPCGKAKSKNVDFSFEGFLNDDLKECLLSLFRTPEYGSLDENNAEIDVGLPNGVPEYIPEQQLGEFRPHLYPALKGRIDEMAMKFCFPNVVSKPTTTTFMTSAWLGRIYLAFLFPCNVVQEAQSFTNSLRLFNLFVTRLDDIISEIVNGFKKEKEPGDGTYWSELSASLAILYFGLLHAQERYKAHPNRPICGDENLPQLLAHRIELTKEYLDLLLCHPGLSCEPGWLTTFGGSLEDLRSNVKIYSLSIRTVPPAGLMSVRSLSASSHGSTSIGTSYTPPSSIEASPPRDPGTVIFDTTIGTRRFDTNPRLPFSPSIEIPPLPWSHVQDSKFNKFVEPPPEPPPSNFMEHNSNSPSFAVTHGTALDMLIFSTFPDIHTSPDHGFEDFKSLEPNGVQVSMGEQGPDHVPVPLPYMYGNGTGTSVLESHDPFLDLHHTLLDNEEMLAENPIDFLSFYDGDIVSYDIDQDLMEF